MTGITGIIQNFQVLFPGCSLGTPLQLAQPLVEVLQLAVDGGKVPEDRNMTLDTFIAHLKNKTN